MRDQRRLVSMLTVAATVGTFAWAAGPFEVRRSLEVGVDDAPPVAVVATAPFDESVLRSHDASNYFYAVYDAGGNRLDISVQRLPVDGVIRIGFDDGDPGSAPVGSGTSSVGVAPASIRADGVQLATITIVPRDDQGRMLGRGLAVSLDAALLWPALAGPVVDLGDGTYVVQATATTPGVGAVRVTVESVLLSTQPSIEATALGGSLRDLAILQLRDLTAPGGRLDASIDLRPARNRALEALRTMVNEQPARDDNALKTDLDGALRELEALGTPEAAALAEDILEIARMIATWNVDQARLECGVCPKADAALADAIALHLSGGGWTDVVDAYAWAVEMAIQARQICSVPSN